jgi:ferredoxin
MIAVDQNVFHVFLAKQDEQRWAEVVDLLLPSVHPVDQMATKIWFSFWPLRLARELQESKDTATTAKKLQLDGKYHLEDQLDSSVEYFLGSRYWSGVKRAILDHAESAKPPEDSSLEQQICSIATKVAVAKSVEESFVLGITAVGVMSLQQIGLSAFASSVGRSFESKNEKSAEQWLRTRNGGRRGLRGFLGLAGKTHRVTFDGNESDCAFQAMNGQDLSMASSSDKRDYTNQDHRRIAGPIPAQCRSGACGYCWIGVIGGKENISGITEFEKQRLRLFGYVSQESEVEKYPHVRLACQSKCYGNVSVVIPPWNGVLNGHKP